MVDRTHDGFGRFGNIAWSLYTAINTSTRGIFIRHDADDAPVLESYRANGQNERGNKFQKEYGALGRIADNARDSASLDGGFVLTENIVK